ncbi:MAG: hypothetical protein ACR2OL_08175 [Anderseniella sp.]
MPSDSDVREQLERMLAHNSFEATERRKNFLGYIVDEALSGRAERLKGYTIAVSVFDRDESFDADADPVVRLEARRLRRDIEHYYLTAGQNDPVVISIPKGAYVPSFELRTPDRPVLEDQNETLPPTSSQLHSGSRSRSRARVLIAAAVIMALAVSGVLATYHFFSPPAKETATTAKSSWGDLPVLAVLPIEVDQDTSITKQAALGLAQDIVTDLTRVPGIRVIAHSSSSQAIGSPNQIATLISDFGATHAIRGNLQVKRQGFRLNVSLIDINTLQQSWADRFDYRLDERFEVQTKIAKHVSEALSVTLLPDQAARFAGGRWNHREGRILFEQALALTNPPTDPVRFEAALALLGRVTNLEPDLAYGHGGLAYVEAVRVWFGHVPQSEQSRQKISEHAAKALAMDPASAEAHVALAISAMNTGDADKSVALAGLAVEYQPSSSYAFAHLGVALAFAGRAAEAVTNIETAIRLDPNNPRLPFRNMLTVARFHSGDYRGALNVLRENLAMGGPYGPHMMVYQAACYSALGQHQEERATLELLKQAITAPGAFSVEGWLRRASSRESYMKPLIDQLVKARRLQ